ncbi:MAG: hypothetical protein HFH60_09850 [Lachnospiraceae bacterium]|nr:hypothetical protein [Lachnospiraceae bacterium]
MNKQNNYPYFLFATDILSGVKDRFSQQKNQAVAFAEQLIQYRDLSYIPKIISCFQIEADYLPQLDDGVLQYMQLQLLDADMRRLSLICEILIEENELPESRLFFLEQVENFEDLIGKYVRITFLLRRMEFSLPEEALKEAANMFMEEQVSVCALRKIMDSEIFADKENKYNQALKMKKMGGVLKSIQIEN